MRISDWSSDVCSSDLLDQTKEHAAGRWRCFSSCEWKRRRKIAAKTRIGDPFPPAKRHQIKSVRKRRYAFRHEPYPCRSEARRVGKGCGRTCRSRWEPVNSKNKKTQPLNKATK